MPASSVRDSNSILQAAGLSVRFGGLTAVDDVSLELEHGKILGLIGPNGAGKTTLFNALTGYARLGGGRVTYLGRDVTRTRPSSAPAEAWAAPSRSSARSRA